ncbi:hypothetical protein [Sphingomonas sp. PP-F2F-A104-K0414]|uniref:hypothetical protein n=1 Tax=Sphingomonas sp. PP-F2F-A104-K0414 TaxID=2135661 RepID=UPI001FB1EDBC|nr:hypothetical protein [Sphingomonas sp. PP-F2F-A104-K0414]
MQPAQWGFDPPPGRLHPPLGTRVGAPDPDHRLEPVSAMAGSNRADQRQQLGSVVWHDAGQRGIDGRRGIDRQAQHGLELVGPLASVVRCIIVPDAKASGLRREAEALFAVAQGLLRQLAVMNVLQRPVPAHDPTCIIEPGHRTRTDPSIFGVARLQPILDVDR